MPEQLFRTLPPIRHWRSSASSIPHPSSPTRPCPDHSLPFAHQGKTRNLAPVQTPSPPPPPRRTPPPTNCTPPPPPAAPAGRPAAAPPPPPGRIPRLQYPARHPRSPRGTGGRVPNPCHWRPDGLYVAHQHPIQLMAAMRGTVRFTMDFNYYPSHCPLQTGQFLPFHALLFHVSQPSTRSLSPVYDA